MKEEHSPTQGKYWICHNCKVTVHEGEEPQDYPYLHDEMIELGGD